MAITIISKTEITDGKLPNDYEIEEITQVEKTDKIKIETELKGMATQKKGIESAVDSYNIHVARIKKAEVVGEAIADLTEIPTEIKLSIPEINFKTDPIIFDNNV